MDLFQSLDDLKPFIFRITDNGGESADRFTVMTCDGDYYAMSGNPFAPQGVGMTGEGFDPQIPEENVEAGTERDLRWIDLPVDCQRCVMGGLNQGFADYLERAPVAASRDEAISFEGWQDWEYTSRASVARGNGPLEVIYKDGELFKVRRDDMDDDPEFNTFREALLYTLPEDYDVSGPEYHTTVDLWDTEGGPAPLWDRETDPPAIDEDHKQARVVITHDTGGEREEIVAWFATVTDAENFLGTSATIDPDDLHEGKYSICDHDDPDAG